jgi:Flp pilus assembly protein TadG
MRCRSSARRATSARARRSAGQASVELALTLPLVVVLLLALVQVGLVVRGQILVTHAAREGARAAAVDADPDAPRRAAVGATSLDADRVVVTRGPRGAAGTPTRVTVTYRLQTDVPLVGAVWGDVTLEATATMRVETAAGAPPRAGRRLHRPQERPTTAANGEESRPVA